MTRLRANILLLFTGAIWGMGFVAQSTAMSAIGPFLFIGLRFLIATIAIFPLALRESRLSMRPVDLREWRIFGGIGVILFAGMAAQQAGLMTTSVTNSGFLTGLYLVMVPLFGVALFREFPHWVVWPSAITALAGIFLLSGGALEGLRTGDWLTILCAGFWALQILFIHRYANDTGRPVTLAVTQFAVAAVLGLAIAFAFERIDMSAIRLALPEIAFAGIFAGGVAFTMQTIGQRYTTAANAAIILSSEALFAALFGAIFLGERIGGLAAAGCALIFVAMLAVETVPLVLRRRTATP